ncbi:MAG: M28 family peptidase [Candidatus Thalassarchaeaceae archaeon]|nr:M28 family peptidase [Candidatus Thalassarchaeaceae archaeon]
MPRVEAICIALLLVSAPLAGCLSPGPGEGALIPSEDMAISPTPLVGAQLQSVEFAADRPMSVHVPYFVLGDDGLFANGTTLQFPEAGTQTIEMIAPSNFHSIFVLLGEVGRESWQVRPSNHSWGEWFASEKFQISPYSWVEHPVVRENRSGYSVEEGGLHGTGLIDGLSVYEWMEVFADPDSGYNDRWGPFTLYDPAYERAASFMQGELQALGYDAQVHRYWISDFSYAVNVCGYKTGTVLPDEWLVIGAHLDIAEAGSPPGGGTHIGAHDNGAGVALMLEAGSALAQFDHRRTIAICFWSNEENGYDGVDSWIDNIPAGVTVSNYLNADAVGTNWPGYYTLVVDCIPNHDDEKIGDQWEMIRMLEWVGSQNNNISDALQLGREIFHTEGYPSMKDEDSSDQKRQSISVHDSDRGRSDYERIADQLGVVSVDWGSLTGGSDCYHGACDTLNTMVDMMVSDNATGQQNLAESFDLISWWVFTAALTLDETPIYDDP